MQVIKREKLTFLNVTAVVGAVSLDFPTGTLPAIADGQIYVILDVATPNAAWGTLPGGLADGDIIERVSGAWVIKYTAASRQIGEKVYNLDNNLDYIYIGNGAWVDQRQKTIGLFDVVQNNTFNQGDVVYYNEASGLWELAQANDEVTCGKGIISRVNGFKFDIVFAGEFSWTHGITVFNSPVYLSAANAGQVTDARPSSTGDYVQQVGVAKDANTFIAALGSVFSEADFGGGGAGGDKNYELKTADFTTVAGGGHYLIEAAGQSITISLRAAPVIGETIRVLIAEGTTDAVFIAPQGGKRILLEEGTEVTQLDYESNDVWELNRFGGRAVQAIGKRTIAQTNIFPELAPIYKTGSGSWALANATSTGTLNTAFAIGVTANTFDAVTAGTINVPAHGFQVGAVYFLDNNGQPALDLSNSNFEQPLFYVLDDNHVQLLDPHAWRLAPPAQRFFRISGNYQIQEPSGTFYRVLGGANTFITPPTTPPREGDYWVFSLEGRSNLNFDNSMTLPSGPYQGPLEFYISYNNGQYEYTARPVQRYEQIVTGTAVLVEFKQVGSSYHIDTGGTVDILLPEGAEGNLVGALNFYKFYVNSGNTIELKEGQNTLDTFDGPTEVFVQRNLTNNGWSIKEYKPPSGGGGGGGAHLVGEIITYAGITPPSNDYILCAGGSFNQITYPDLFAVLGTTTLPDLRGQFIRGAANQGQIDGFTRHSDTTRRPRSAAFTGGTNTQGNHAHDIYAAKNRTGTAQWSDAATMFNSGGNTYSSNGSGGRVSGLLYSNGDHNHTVSINGGGDAETAPVHVYMAYMIRATL